MLRQFFLLFWNQFSGRKGWKLNCSKQPKVNIQNWPASILNILSSTGRNCSKQEGTVPNRWHAEWKLNVDSANTSNKTPIIWSRTAEGVEMQRLRKGTTLTPMPWKLYSKDEYAESSHYAAHQEYANWLRITFQQMPSGVCGVWQRRLRAGIIIGDKRAKSDV